MVMMLMMIVIIIIKIMHFCLICSIFMYTWIFHFFYIFLPHISIHTITLSYIHLFIYMNMYTNFYTHFYHYIGKIGFNIKPDFPILLSKIFYAIYVTLFIDKFKKKFLHEFVPSLKKDKRQSYVFNRWDIYTYIYIYTYICVVIFLYLYLIGCSLRFTLAEDKFLTPLVCNLLK
jgi:hypothetical protein